MKSEKSGIIFQCIVVFLTAFPIWLPLLLIGSYYLGKCLTGTSYYTDIYEKSWNIEIPSSWKEEYSDKGEIGFHGEGERYSIYKLEKENDDLLRLFSDQKDDEIEKEVNEILQDINPKASLNFEREYQWLKLSREEDCLIIIYSPKESKGCIVQKII